MRRGILLLLVVAAGAAALLAGAASVQASGRGLDVKPINGQAVGHGLRLWVHVFYAKGGTPGPPSGHGGGGGSVDCTDINTQTGYSAPFATTGTVAFHANTSTFPSGAGNVASALSAAASTWDGQINGPHRLTVQSDGTATGPSQDGVSELGWVRIVPKNVLAATWTWVDQNNRITEADLFFNTSWTWNVFSGCPTTATGKFDIQDIATHEMGHALGLSHYSDTDAQATMYPSAPSDELRKRTLTQGDIDALGVALGP
jgi:hypothetical protein